MDSAVGTTPFQRSSLRAVMAGISPSGMLIAVAVCLGFPAVLLFTAGSTLNQAGFLDPYVYAAYIHDYGGTLERFGRTYYSTRISYIYPERVLTYLLGLESGYYAFRFLALSSATTAVFAIGMRFYGYAPAILAAAWLCFTPWLPRSLFWTYSDGIAIVYLLVGTTLILVPTQRRLSAHVAAGAAFALAVNCNLLMLAIGGLLGPGWALFHRHRGGWWLAWTFLALAAGFIATYFALGLALNLEFPGYDVFFEITAIRTAINLLGGAMTTWYSPLSQIFSESHFFGLLIPPTFLTVALVLVSQLRSDKETPTDRMDFAVFVLAYLASVIGLALIFHFWLHSGWLSLFYYIVYFLPGCVLALVILAGEAEHRGGRFFGPVVVYGGTGLIVFLWLARPMLPDTGIGSSIYIWLVVAATTVGAALALRCTAVASLVLVAGAVVLTLGLYQHGGSYEIRKRAPDQSEAEWDVYRGAIFLQQFVNANVSLQQPVGFWYGNKRDHRWLNSIQSMYLWGYSRVFPSAFPALKDHPGMPLVDEGFRNAIAARRTLVLLGVTEPEIDAGLAALEAAAFSYREIRRTRFQGRVWGYSATLIELKPPQRTLGPWLFNVPLARLKPAKWVTASSSPEGLRLITAKQQWSYSLVGRLLADADPAEGAAIVRIRLEVEAGSVGIAVSASGSGNLIREVAVHAAPETQVIDLDIPDLRATDSLIIRNQLHRGRSRVVIQSVDVYRSN